MLTNKKDIQTWLHQMQIVGSVINKDLSVDVMGNVNLSYKKLSTLPVQFGLIKGYFNALCNDFISFEGFPFVVEGNFQCHLNHDIDFSSFNTQKIGKNFFCLSSVNEENLKKLFRSQVSVKGNFSHLTHHEENRIAFFDSYYLNKENKNNTTSYMLDIPFSQFKEVMNSYFEKEQLENVIYESSNQSHQRLKI